MTTLNQATAVAATRWVPPTATMRTDPTAPTCTCDDPQLNTMLELVAGGLDQWSASIRTWGGAA